MSRPKCHQSKNVVEWRAFFVNHDREYVGTIGRARIFNKHMSSPVRLVEHVPFAKIGGGQAGVLGADHTLRT